MVPRAIKRQTKRVCGMRDLHCCLLLLVSFYHLFNVILPSTCMRKTSPAGQTRESCGCTRVVLLMPPHLHTSHNVMGICADSPAGFSAQAGVGVLVGWWRAQRDRVDLSTSKLANDDSDGAQRLGLPCEIWQTGIRRFIYPLSKYLRKYVTDDIFSGQKHLYRVHLQHVRCAWRSLFHRGPFKLCGFIPIFRVLHDRISRPAPPPLFFTTSNL